MLGHWKIFHYELSTESKDFLTIEDCTLPINFPGFGGL